QHQDAGLFRTASLGDKVWEDSNVNGIQDSNETGLAGVSIELLDLNHTVVGATVTDANGLYQLHNLVPGKSYQLHIPSPAGFVNAAFRQGSNTELDSDIDIDGYGAWQLLNSGENRSSVDAGFYKAELSTSVGNRIWEDENHNGQQDLGEWNKGIAGVTVELLDVNNQVLKTTTSDAGGNYLFSAVAAGTYKVHVLAPIGYLFTPDNHYDETSDSDTNSSGISAPFTIAAADKNLDVDAGLYRTASIGDKVWLDSNQNGLQDSNENGIAGITVNLLNASNANALLRSVVTDSNGEYLFNNLDVGNYSIAVVAPTGYAFSDAFVQNASQPDLYNNNDSNVDKNGQTAPINIWVSGYQNLSFDAGLYQTTATASVGNRVWEDANCNGLQDEGEWNKGMAGITVQLLNAADQVINSTQTDAGGHYLFNNLEPGNYKIHVVAPSTTYQFTQANQNGANAGNSVTDSNGTSALFTLTAGDNNLSMDAGLYSKAQLGDRVWLDDNQNGIQDGNEQGLAGVTVNLLNALDANKFIKSVLTDTNGHYEFNDLDLGNYTVQVQAPAGYAYSTSNVGTDKNLDSNVDSNGQTAAVTIWVSGFTDLSLDAGLVANAAIQASSVVADGTQLITGADAGLAANSLMLLPEQDAYAALTGFADTNSYLAIPLDNSNQLLSLTGQPEFSTV
ncbi:MAG: SdrD B-like domain-containing protein, partial [Methylococcales bacterium]